ncbi:MAG: glycosyltransferase family 39 protein [Candidatus Omnitrophica bacterium]|nr:glycosyltransferase family 39 protein [Candidatus Omnitrophota bacterium]
MKRFQIRNFCSIRRGLFILFFTILFLLRLYKLGYHDFWYDEIFTISYAKHPWSNWNAPFYWILLHSWIKLFGISEFSLRFPSLIFSFLSVILIFFLGRDLFNKRVGICAALIMGVSPFHLWYAQEARDYSLILFLGLLSSYFLFKAIKRGKAKFWLVFILSSVLGIYTNYFFIFLFIAQILYIFVFFKKLKLNLKNMIPFLIIGLCFLPYLERFLSKFFYVWGGFWIPCPSFKSIIITIETFILGYNVNSFLYLAAGILATIFFIRAMINLRDRGLRFNLIFCLFLFLIPIVSIFIFSKILFSVYLDRTFIIFSPYFYLILSLGIVSLGKYLKLPMFVLFLFLLFTSDYAYFKDWMPTVLDHHMGTYIKKPVRPIVQFINRNRKKEDLVAFTNPCVAVPFKYYSEKRGFYYFFDPEISDSSWGRPVRASKYRIPFHRINSLNFKRLWIIASNWARDGNLDENSSAVKGWLDENFKLSYSQKMDGVWIFRYEY